MRHPSMLPFLFAVCSVCPLAHARDPLDRPNVVVVFLDDSGWGDYGHNGNPVIETPHIDRLAREGASFTQFYVASSACTASRYALLTGRWPSRSGLGSWVIGPGAKPHLHPRETTIADALRSAGYRTGIFGKWHLGTPNQANGMTPNALPLAHGFEAWIGTNVSHDYDNALLLRSDPAGSDPIPGYATIARNLPSDPAVCASLTGRYADEAVRFIRANKERPFFAYVAHNMPHLGLFASETFKGRSRRGLLGDVMAEVDQSVGSILKTLEDEGIARNTLVVFSSDNGPWVLFQDAATSKYGEARLHVGYAQPFRDGKGSTWEGGYRVPGIWHWPGVIAPKRQLEPANTCDVLPTVAALAGATLPTDRTVDGRDIRPLLAPERFPGRVADFVHLYHYTRNQIAAVRQGPWKLMVETGSQLKTDHGFAASEEKPLLFHVEQDIGERIDRAAEQPHVMVGMKECLRSCRERIRAEGTFVDRP